MDKVQHFEIAVDDIARARKFYEGLFSWKTTEMPMPEGGVYVGLQTGPMDDKKHMPKESGYIGGGMFKRDPHLPMKGTTVAITVEDLDVMLEKVKTAGGEVLMGKMEIGGMGFYAYIKDTEGNVIGLWQNLEKPQK